MLVAPFSFLKREDSGESWVVCMNYDYDVAVIGAGSGWLTVAFWLAGAGKKIALIEWWLIGGDCTNFWCVPSKALIDISKYNPEIGFKKALEIVRERRQIIQDEETVEKVESHGPKVYQWYASFEDENTLNITDGKNSKITAKNIVIATGSRAVKLEIEGVKSEDVLTNEEIFEQTGDIKNLVIIGWWYIGCELAESIAALWVKVHLVQRNKDLVPNEEPESRDLLKKIFLEKGIEVYTEMTATSASDWKITLTSKDEKTKTTVPYDKVLIALWRKVNTEKLNLEKAEVKYSKKGISVNKFNKTNKKHIFAIGDCVENNPQFTHWANNEWRGVVRNIIVQIHNSSVRKSALPSVLYTHKEIARVGKSEDELLKKYTREEFVTKIQYFDTNDRAKVTNDTQGFIKIHFTRLTGKILGATIFSSGAWEMLSVITSAMDNKTSAYKLSKTIFPYPTKSDLIKRVMGSYVVDTLWNFKNEVCFFMRTNLLQILTAIVWVLLITSFFWYKSSYELSFEDLALGIYNFLWGSIWWPVLYVLIYTIRPIVLFPGTAITFMSGALFGFWFGTLYTVIAGTSSAIFAYFMWQVFGKKLLSDEGGGIIGTLKNQVDNDPFMSVLMTRLLFFPYDITNYACGFLKVDLKKYILATFIWIIPWVSVFVLAGSAFYNSKITSFSAVLADVDTRLLLWAAWLFIITTVFAKVLRKINR